MSPVLPFDIVSLIIDIIGENNDRNLLKELALVSHSFLHICSKHLFATVELRDAHPDYYVTSSKEAFIELLESRPDVVEYIRKFTYIVSNYHLLLPILPKLLRTISRLNCLTITGSMSRSNWNSLDSSLTSAFLHLMHLPTINHIDLSYIQHFPLSSLTPSVNLIRLDISYLRYHKEDDIPDILVLSEVMPRIREFHTLKSALLTTKLLHAKRQDGQPAFNLMNLRRLSICFEDRRNIRYLLQNAKFLEKLHLSALYRQDLVGLHDILSHSAGTLKILVLTVPIYSAPGSLALAGLCEELEAMAGHNMLEALSFEVHVNCYYQRADSIGSIIQKVEKVLVNPGWPALRQVSFTVSMTHWDKLLENHAEWSEALQSLPDKYLSHLSKLESVAFNYSFYIEHTTANRNLNKFFGY
jgi:hypothetical protein